MSRKHNQQYSVTLKTTFGVNKPAVDVKHTAKWMKTSICLIIRPHETNSQEIFQEDWKTFQLTPEQGQKFCLLFILSQLIIYLILKTKPLESCQIK